MGRRAGMAVVVLAVMVLGLWPTVAGAGGGGAICDGYGDGNTVVMRDSCFQPVGLLAQPGTIAVRNEGQMAHTFTSVDGLFDTGSLQAGEQAEIEVPEPGVYRIRCTLHSGPTGAGMTGLLVVGDGVADPELTSTVSDSGGRLLPVAVVLLVVGAAVVVALRPLRRLRPRHR